MSYQSMLNDVYQRVVLPNEVCSEEIFIDTLEHVLVKFTKPHHKTTWSLEDKLNLFKDHYGLCGNKCKSIAELSKSLNLKSKWPSSIILKLKWSIRRHMEPHVIVKLER